MSRMIYRPIAVTMIIIAIVVMGLLAIKSIPVSLMPDIDIPQITVQTNMPGYSAQEIERDVTSKLRGQLMQVAGVKDIRSESRMDAGFIVMKFDPGSNIDLLFIEVNEKIDRMMNTMPKEMERPKIVKASASDIPAFYLDVYVKDSTNRSSGLQFAQLGQYVRTVVSKRIEQMPQTAMVDISGTIGTEILCVPDFERLNSLGIGPADIEEAIKQNNITLEALSVVDGIYRYNIHFDSQLLTKDDIANIYIRHEDRLIQLKDIATLTERVKERNGMVMHNNHDAITLAVIKQNDARMEDLQKNMETLIKELQKDNPGINFELTRDQTKLLSYTINNLKGNLLLAALLACIILFVFMRQWRLSLLVIITIPLSLIITIMCFYLIGVTLNIISLSGLILGVGMIVDNSIIVIDNIMQKWREGRSHGIPFSESVVKGSTEVFTPMLSSVLTTCSVFVPLIFLSGVAGALFFDQAMGVTIALFASLIVASVVVPIYFFNLYKTKKLPPETTASSSHNLFVKLYEKLMKWSLRNARIIMFSFMLIIPMTAVLFVSIEKKRLPDVPHEDALMTVDWNEGLSAEENRTRTQEVITAVEEKLESTTSMIGSQEFLLSHTKDITASEAVVYLKTKSTKDLLDAEYMLTDIMEERYPNASIEFGESGNIYEMIFNTDESDLEIHLQDKNGERPTVNMSRDFIDTLRSHFPHVTIMPVMTETNIRYVASPEQMAFYNVTYEKLYGRLKELLNKDRVFEINDGAQPVPVIIGTDGTRWSQGILQSVVQNSENVDVPLQYLISESRGEDYKRLQSGADGSYYSIQIKARDRDVEQMMSFTDDYVHRRGSELSASFTGGYFSSRQLIHDLTLVLSIALALLFFILAAQFESFIQPFIILLEMVVDVFFVILMLWALGESLNVMSMIGIVVMSGIVINDSILKIATINRLRNEGMSLTRAVFTAGHSRLRPIIMTSLTTILALIPFLSRSDMGSALQYPLSLTLIIGMVVGTMVSLFFVPLLYWLIAKFKARHGLK